MPVSDADRKGICSRLSRIEGQIHGLKRTVNEDRYCGDILDQIHSVQQTFKSVGAGYHPEPPGDVRDRRAPTGADEAARESYDEIVGFLKKEL